MEILSRPELPHSKDPEEQSFARDIEKSNIDSWICLACRRRTLHILPHSRRWRIFRDVWVLVVASPFIWMLFKWGCQLEPLSHENRALEDKLVLPWLLTVVAATCGMMLDDRGKYCTECGWRRGPKDMSSGD
jgi:hypothetical protein